MMAKAEQTYGPAARSLAPWLWLLFLLFCLRVIGQLLVAVWRVPYLPPMEEWFSGLVPYPTLFAAQVLIIALLATVCVQFSRGDGWFVRPRRGFGMGLLWFGSLYLAVMIGRYIIHMAIHPEERWFGGSIPIFFHWLLAAYVLMVAKYHLMLSSQREPIAKEEEYSGGLITRRRVLELVGTGVVVAAGGFGLVRLLETWLRKALDPLFVNDMHSHLNGARVAELLEPSSLEELYGLIKGAKRSKKYLSVCGSRHAMGGQQFLEGGSLIDTRKMKTVIDLDEQRGLVEIEAGIEWPDLVDHLLAVQKGQANQWSISTKQTGADKLTVGGALSANAHGRSLTKKPFISDVESFLLVNGDGDMVRCSRAVNPELFSLAIGGYGLFGVAHSVVLRLVHRQKLRRVVEVLDIDDLAAGFDRRIADGFVLGDFQFATDENSSQFLRQGVFSCYQPVDMATPIPEGQDVVSDRAWEELVYLAHTDKSRAFELYSEFYLKSSGQIYWSDTSQIGAYPVDYHRQIDQRMKAGTPASEMITELYVPRHKLASFMSAAAEAMRKKNGNVIYGTIRLIEKDDESFLAWAKQDYACVIFNLHVIHSPKKIEEAIEAFRALIDLAIERDGSYYLTYHRWARKDQVLACYPQFPDFLAKKLQYDPDERFQSDWYRHYKGMFA
ncbi:MAG: FAD-binding protein [Fimbriimonadales bacterium]